MIRDPKPMADTAKNLAAAKNVVKPFTRDYEASRVDDDSVAEPRTFAERLALLGRLAGSESALARMCGLGRATLSSAARADGGRIQTARLLRETIGVDLNWLICGDGSPGELHFPKSTSEAIADRVRRPVRPRTSGRQRAQQTTRPPKNHR